MKLRVKKVFRDFFLVYFSFTLSSLVLVLLLLLIKIHICLFLNWLNKFSNKKHKCQFWWKHNLAFFSFFDIISLNQYFSISPFKFRLKCRHDENQTEIKFRRKPPSKWWNLREIFKYLCKISSHFQLSYIKVLHVKRFSIRFETRHWKLKLKINKVYLAKLFFFSEQIDEFFNAMQTLATLSVSY